MYKHSTQKRTGMPWHFFASQKRTFYKMPCQLGHYITHFLEGCVRKRGLKREQERERERHRRFLTSEDMRLYKCYTKVYHGRKMQGCCVSHKCERGHIFCTRVHWSKTQRKMRFPAAARWQLQSSLCSPDFLHSETSKDMIDLM